jgi:hypothetical protein
VELARIERQIHAVEDANVLVFNANVQVFDF